LLLKYLRPYWLSIVLAYLLAALLGVVSAVVFALIGPSLKILMLQNQSPSLLYISDLLGARLAELVYLFTNVREIHKEALWSILPIALIMLSAIRNSIGTVQWFLWERAGELVSMHLRSDLLCKYLRSDPIGSSEASGTSSQLSGAISMDIKMAREYVVHYYGGLPRELFQAFFYVVTLIMLSPTLFLVFFIVVIPFVSVIQKMGKTLRRRAGKALQDNSELVEWLQQRMLGYETIKHFGTERLEISNLKNLTENLLQRFLRAARAKSRISPSMEFVAVTAMVGALYYSLSHGTKQGISGSVQLSFFSTLAVLAQAVAKIARYYNSNREAGAAIGRLKQLFSNLDSSSKEKLFKIPEHVEDGSEVLQINNISVAYPGTRAYVLEDFSYRFHKGKIYCIVGSSGAGKTTLFNVILGLIEPQKGTVQLSQMSRDASSSELQVIYVPQFVHLINDSIALNVAYPHNTPHNDKVGKALSQVGLAEFIDSLPDGINTCVGSYGLGLSGGQAQRILLARLFYHTAPLVLVDEGTSALDPELEAVFYDVIKKLSETGVTVLMITHRLGAMQIADEVLTFEKGRLV
jgi:ABC-type multidrug transport system fused ATPase/permease subunit